MRAGVKVVKLLIAIGLLAMLFAGYGVWQNNRSVSQPDRAELKRSLDKGVGWLAEHRNVMLDDGNPMLWWMVQESAALTQSTILKDMYAQYQKRYFAGKHNAWAQLFEPAAAVPMHLWELNNLPDYNLFILYGVSCSPELAGVEVVKRQMEISFCDSKPFSPACVTHQMMGFRFMRHRGCGDTREVERRMAVLRDRVLTQLTWDFRVVDVYIQRVLMLVDTGAIDQIKPVWIRRVVNAQGNEGGWSGFQPLLPLREDVSMGFSARGLGVQVNKANFHATAQGVLLMSMLLNGQALH